MVEPLEAVCSLTGCFGDARYKAQPTKVWTGQTKYKKTGRDDLSTKGNQFFGDHRCSRLNLSMPYIGHGSFEVPPRLSVSSGSTVLVTAPWRVSGSVFECAAGRMGGK